ncbi:MAG: methyltransferase domain-containing protein [Alphaproteobacteria bacterium]|nr:methyltransferase domain-containing protein [Alphaproteobacteria bacterium]
MTSYADTNLKNWECRVPLHLKSYPLEKFMAGWDPLFPIEAKEIGDITGLDVLHLQCHIGMDSLGLVRRGANVTGLDFSPSAIKAAQDLARETELKAKFVEGDIYETPKRIRKKFDLVYTTWGTITWLPDIVKWSAVVAKMLKPGGRLYLADGHPAMLIMEEEEGRLVHKYPWRTNPDAPLRFDEEITYTGEAMPKDGSASYDWAHPLSSIIGGLLDNGLRLDFLHEHETVAWQYVNLMVPDPDEPRMFRLPKSLPQLPLSFSLGATKSAS